MTLSTFRRPAVTAALLGFVLNSCGGDSAGPTPPESDTRQVTVIVETTGEDIDRDGYEVLLGSRALEVPASGSVTFEGMPPGDHQVMLSGVAANCDVPGGEARTVTVSASRDGEVRFDVECTLDRVGLALSPLTCSGLSVPDHALPLDWIDIGSLPSALSNPAMARVRTPGGSDVILGFVLTDSLGITRMLVPLHPEGAVAGGEVEVRISDEGQTCPPFSLRLDPLPEAPGEFAAVAQLLQEVVRLQAQLAGTSVAELMETQPDALPLELVSLAVGQSLIDQPENPNSLYAYVAGTAPEAVGVDPMLLDRVVARTGIRAELEGKVAGLQDAVLAAGRGAAAPDAVVVTTLSCRGNIETAEEMDACMELALEKASPIQDRILSDLSWALSVAATVPALKPVAKPLGLILWASKHYDDGAANLLPSRFVSIDVELVPDTFLEDEAGPGSWGPAYVTASSNGWQLDALVLESLLRLVKERALYKKALDFVAKFNASPLADEFVQNLLSLLATQTAKWGISLVPESGILDLPPETFGPVDISAPEWSEVRIVAGQSIRLISHDTYEPLEVGTTLIEVSTEIGRFGGANIASDDPFPEIRVRELDLDIDPEEILVEPGEIVFFEVMVQESVSPDSVELQPGSPVQGEATIEYRGGARHLVFYQAPELPDFEKPDLLTVRHTARAGARREGPERTATATIRFGSIEITAEDTQCLVVGEPIALEADVRGFQEPNVEWGVTGPASLEASASSLTATLTPSGEGAVTVSATVVGYPQVSDDVALTVGACTCSFSLTVGATTLEARPGDEVHFTDWPPFTGGDHELVSVHILDQQRGVETALYPTDGTQVSGPEELPSGPGSFPGIAGGGVGAEFFYGSEGNVGVFVVDAYEKQKTLAGSMLGSVVRLGDPDDVPIPFSATFSVTVESVLGARYRCTVPDEG